MLPFLPDTQKLPIQSISYDWNLFIPMSIFHDHVHSSAAKIRQNEGVEKSFFKFDF